MKNFDCLLPFFQNGQLGLFIQPHPRTGKWFIGVGQKRVPHVFVRFRTAFCTLRTALIPLVLFEKRGFRAESISGAFPCSTFLVKRSPEGGHDTVELVPEIL